MRTISLFLALILSFGAIAQPATQPADALVRGKLLYTTHCISCHAVEIHWRDKKLVNSWSDLKIQVQRWQQTAGLEWSSDDIEQVSAYLNEAYYHLPDAGKIGLGLQIIKK